MVFLLEWWQFCINDQEVDVLHWLLLVYYVNSEEVHFSGVLYLHLPVFLQVLYRPGKYFSAYHICFLLDDAQDIVVGLFLVLQLKEVVKLRLYVCIFTWVFMSRYIALDRYVLLYVENLLNTLLNVGYLLLLIHI